MNGDRFFVDTNVCHIHSNQKTMPKEDKLYCGWTGSGRARSLASHGVSCKSFTATLYGSSEYPPIRRTFSHSLVGMASAGCYVQFDRTCVVLERPSSDFILGFDDRFRRRASRMPLAIKRGLPDRTPIRQRHCRRPFQDGSWRTLNMSPEHEKLAQSISELPQLMSDVGDSLLREMREGFAGVIAHLIG